MTESDPLMAALRQAGNGKTTLRAASRITPMAKDAKSKIDQFREQLQLIAQGAKRGSQPDIKEVDATAAQGPKLLDRRGEATDPVTTHPNARVREPDEDSAQPADENSPHRHEREVTSSTPEWRTPEAPLSSVISRLDRIQSSSQQDDRAPPREVPSQSRVEQRDTSFKDVSSEDMSLKDLRLQAGDTPKTQKADALPEQRFASSIGAAETRAAAPLKVVVREQETHFAPVQQVTLLQKIVDRIAPELSAAPVPPGADAADVALPGMHRATDAPLRMLTLQLDPPNMGTVTVRMRLAGDAVEVQLLADRHETTQLLRHERGALMDAMQSAGYTFDIASIDQTRTGDPNAGGSQPQPQSDQRPSHQAQGGPQIDNGTAQRQSGDAQAGTRQNRQEHEQLAKQVERNPDEAVVRDRNGGAVYL